MCSNNSVRRLLFIASLSPCIVSISLPIVTHCIHFLNGTQVRKMKDERGHCRSLQSYLLCAILSPSGPVCLSEAGYWQNSRNIWYYAMVLNHFYSCLEKKEILKHVCDIRAELNSIRINAGLASTEDPHPGWMTVRAAVWQDEVCSFPYLLTHSLFSECLKLITASRNQTEGWKSALSLQWSHSSS